MHNHIWVHVDIHSITHSSSDSSGKWEWMSDSPSLLQPCTDAVTYYSQFGRVAGFTTVGPGRRFRKLLEEHLELLRWPPDLPEDKELSVKGEDGKLYHWILPSFFQMLQDLTSEGLEFSVIFRTFGTDLPRVLTAVRRAVEDGSHPLFPDLPALKVVDIWGCLCYPRWASWTFHLTVKGKCNCRPDQVQQ